MGLNTLIGWRAYFNTRQAVGGSGERGVLEDRFARKIPLSRQPRPRGHQSASFSPSVLHARTHGHDDKPWPAGLRGTSKYFEKVIVDGKHRSTCASSAVVGLGNHFAFRATRRRRRFKPTRASTERRSLLAQARIRIAASRARISRGTTGRSAACGRVRDRDVHARRVR